MLSYPVFSQDDPGPTGGEPNETPCVYAFSPITADYVIGGTAIPNVSSLIAITGTSNFTNINFWVAADFIIDTHCKFEDCTFSIAGGVSIIGGASGQLVIFTSVGCHYQSCNQVWGGIDVLEGYSERNIDGEWSIYSSIGTQLLHGFFVEGGNSTRIDVSRLNNGVYTLVFKEIESSNLIQKPFVIVR